MITSIRTATIPPAAPITSNIGVPSPTFVGVCDEDIVELESVVVSVVELEVVGVDDVVVDAGDSSTEYVSIELTAELPRTSVAYTLYITEVPILIGGILPIQSVESGNILTLDQVEPPLIEYDKMTSLNELSSVICAVTCTLSVSYTVVGECDIETTGP